MQVFCLVIHHIVLAYDCSEKNEGEKHSIHRFEYILIVHKTVETSKNSVSSKNMSANGQRKQ